MSRLSQASANAAPPAPTPPPTEQPAATDDLYAVVDRLAAQTGRTRKHDLGGMPVEFTGATPRSLPWDQARWVAGSDDFIVLDKQGVEVRPVEQDGKTGTVRLLSNQVIAELGELKSEALLARARELPGGERCTSARDRDALIAFITDYRLREDEARRRLEASRPRRKPGEPLKFDADAPIV